MFQRPILDDSRMNHPWLAFNSDSHIDQAFITLQPIAMFRHESKPNESEIPSLVPARIRSLFHSCHGSALYPLSVPYPPFSESPKITMQERQHSVIAPKVMIISMWSPEAQVWHDRLPSSGLGNLTSRSVHSAGFSMLFPIAFCTQTGDICQVTVGEGEINSAATLMALVLSPMFNLRQTYFLVAGIAGINPRYGTLGTVALARYSVQVTLQYEIDPRSLPSEWSTGYIAYGRNEPLEYPFITYGTEVFELNANLRDKAHSLASKATLKDESGPRQYRNLYKSMEDTYKMALEPPGVIKCDTATSDVYYSGKRLSEAFEDTVSVWTNGTGTYCMSAQEDNAILEVLVRSSIEKLTDFERVMVLRTGCNFDRPPPLRSDLEHLTATQQNGFSISVENIYLAGSRIIKGIIDDWNCTYKDGVAAENYVGDIFGSLGGQPDFGYGSITNEGRVAPGGVDQDLAAREMNRRKLLTNKPASKV
ncbi:purine nucleoside permease-domain-containing protein [Thelonectria olida]|uniref:Purine nucleoside permease-domain-containing protein n=1 Tax=Thelonectria olida TaxID=1576542 RepID=A0A9P8VX90_9HYPO|nr:purine nucleoside permease-domain-containing protein [Thelonectria olida]